MTKHFSIAGLFLTTLLMSNTGYTQTSLDGTKNFTTTAVPFLRISPDARSGAMGDAGIAIDGDENSQYWNVGKMPFNEKKYGIAATYTPWLKDLVPDIFLAYISGYGKFGEDDNQTISASMRYFSLGTINYTDITGAPTGTGSPREYSFDLGYARKLSENLGLGVTGRYIHSAIVSNVSYQPGVDYHPGNAVSADLGLFYTKTKEMEDAKNRKLNLGVVISNLGSKISYNNTRKDFIPMNLGLGAAYTTQFDEYNKITFALDVNKLLVPPQAILTADSNASIITAMTKSFQGGDQLKKLDISLGAEFWYQNQFAVRAGYFYEDKSNGDRQYITAGVGIKYNTFALNCSYIIPQGSGITRNPLSNTLRFTLYYSFDKFETPAPESTPSGEPAPAPAPAPPAEGK